MLVLIIDPDEERSKRLEQIFTEAHCRVNHADNLGDPSDVQLQIENCGPYDIVIDNRDGQPAQSAVKLTGGIVDLREVFANVAKQNGHALTSWVKITTPTCELELDVAANRITPKGAVEGALKVSGQVRRLGRQEYQILRALILKRNTLLTAADLKTVTHNPETDQTETNGSIRTAIHVLRVILKDNNNLTLKTLRGEGFILIDQEDLPNKIQRYGHFTFSPDGVVTYEARPLKLTALQRRCLHTLVSEPLQKITVQKLARLHGAKESSIKITISEIEGMIRCIDTDLSPLEGLEAIRHNTIDLS